MALEVYQVLDIERYATISLRAIYLMRVRGKLKQLQCSTLITLNSCAPCGGSDVSHRMSISYQSTVRGLYNLILAGYVEVIGHKRGKGKPAPQYALTDSGKELVKYYKREWLRQLYALRLIRPNKNKLKGEPLERHNKMLEDEYKRYGIQI